MIKLRQDHPVLRRGSLQAPLYVDEHVVVWARRLGDAWAITAINNDSKTRQVTLPLPEGLPLGEMQDALGGSAVLVHDRGITLEVPALFGRVLVHR